MEPVEALKLATLNPAIQLKIDDRVGSLKAGKDADFVIWNGNPLSIYTRAEQTWVDGVPMFTLERDAELRKADAAERQALIEKVLASGEDQGRSEWSARRNEKQWHCDDVEDVWHGHDEK
jgi:adenine deaminase